MRSPYFFLEPSGELVRLAERKLGGDGDGEQDDLPPRGAYQPRLKWLVAG